MGGILVCGVSSAINIFAQCATLYRARYEINIFSRGEYHMVRSSNILAGISGF